jgi:glycosyltransferase involved in cell wall biosynthesis
VKVCFVSHSPHRGGAETALLETIEVLHERGVDCCVLLPARGELASELTERGIQFHIIPYGLWMARKGTPLWQRLKTATRIAVTVIPVLATVRRWNPDIVYSNTATVCVGAIASFFLRRPHIWHLHEFGYEDHRLIFLLGKKLPYMIMNSLASGWIANSHVVQKKWRQHLDIRKAKVVYYSMHCIRRGNASPSHSAPVTRPRDGTFRCVIVGTLFAAKGQEVAIQAIAELSKGRLKPELLIIGGGDPAYHQQLVDMVAKDRLEKQVIFTGHVDDPFPFFQSADVALVCSKAEAFGRVTIEAMLAGKPVIGSRSGANQELIREGFNGLSYEPGNSNQLAEKIKCLYENRELAEQLGHNGKEWAQRVFTKERYGSELLSFLSSLKGLSSVPVS